MATYSLTVREGMDWAEFFVDERDPRQDDKGHWRYSATWACVSSFGVYGHHWSHMGDPFKKFVQGVGIDYLLSKVAHKQPDNDTVLRSVRRSVLQSRRDKRCSFSEARDAWDAIDTIETESAGDVATLLYNDNYVSKVVNDWCDMETTAYDPQAGCFAKLMWPLFVAAIQPTEPAKG